MHRARSTHDSHFFLSNFHVSNLITWKNFSISTSSPLHSAHVEHTAQRTTTNGEKFISDLRPPFHSLFLVLKIVIKWIIFRRLTTITSCSANIKHSTMNTNQVHSFRILYHFTHNFFPQPPSSIQLWSCSDHFSSSFNVLAHLHTLQWMFLIFRSFDNEAMRNIKFRVKTIIISRVQFSYEIINSLAKQTSAHNVDEV